MPLGDWSRNPAVSRSIYQVLCTYVVALSLVFCVTPKWVLCALDLFFCTLGTLSLWWVAPSKSGVGGKLRSMEGKETVVMIYCMREESMFNNDKNNNHSKSYCFCTVSIYKPFPVYFCKVVER